jgi:hypothetical protein
LLPAFLHAKSVVDLLLGRRLLLLPSLPRFHKSIFFSLPPQRPITRNRNFFAHLSLLQQLSSPVTMLPKLSPYIPGRLPKRIEADT